MTGEAEVRRNAAKVTLLSFPKLRYIFLFLCAWFLCGVATSVIAYIGRFHFSAFDKETVGLAATIGDGFGLANSLFSSAALLFVIWSIRLQQQELTVAQNEWAQNTESQRQQAELMKETARLTAVNHIYTHYGQNYGSGDETGILQAIASGHRRWAIRESFDSFDEVFRENRLAQVAEDWQKLVLLLQAPRPDAAYFEDVAPLVSSLLVDRRLGAAARTRLWSLYEIIRSAPDRLISAGSPDFTRFTEIAAVDTKVT